MGRADGRVARGMACTALSRAAPEHSAGARSWPRAHGLRARAYLIGVLLARDIKVLDVSVEEHTAGEVDRRQKEALESLEPAACRPPIDHRAARAHRGPVEGLMDGGALQPPPRGTTFRPAVIKQVCPPSEPLADCVETVLAAPRARARWRSRRHRRESRRPSSYLRNLPRLRRARTAHRGRVDADRPSPCSVPATSRATTASQCSWRHRDMPEMSRDLQPRCHQLPRRDRIAGSRHTILVPFTLLNLPSAGADARAWVPRLPRAGGLTRRVPLNLAH